jgi:hypothetical protein
MKKTLLRPKKATSRIRKGMTGAKAGGSHKTVLIARPARDVPFSVKEFCGRFRIVRPDLTRLTGYSQRAVDQWAAGDKPSSAAQKQIKEVVRLFDGLADIMESNYVGEWLKVPNEAFDGSSPLQVIERGESDRIWRMIYQLQTGEPI